MTFWWRRKEREGADSAGQEALWQELMGLQPMLRRIINSFEADAGLQQDLLQDVLLAIWHRLGPLAEVDNRRAYCARIARNLCISHVRRETRRPVALELDETAMTSAASASDAESSLEAERLLQGVRSLPLALRDVLALHLEGFSYDEISQVLGVSVSNVGVRLHRARRQLSERLDLDHE